MRPNAAMQTIPPKVSHPAILRWATGSELMAKRPTSLMVHVESHGPRRIYRSDSTQRYFYIVLRKRIYVDVNDILEMLRV